MLFSFFPGIDQVSVKPGYVKISISSRQLKEFIYFIKASSFFKAAVLCDITCVDRLTLNSNDGFRFQVVQILRSISKGCVYEVSCLTNDKVPSICDIYPSASQMESEVFEFFGVTFSDSLTGQKRLLTDYGFVGYPLRKDFPLYGFSQVKYSQLNKSIIHEDVEFSQELNLYPHLVNFSYLIGLNLFAIN